MTSSVRVVDRSRARRWRNFLAAIGPGLVVMLADTDVGSIITAAQSGVQWGYRLLLMQFVLIPILYVVQELTVRLGIFTGKGHGELIRLAFGKRWAWVSVAGLGVTTQALKFRQSLENPRTVDIGRIRVNHVFQAL